MPHNLSAMNMERARKLFTTTGAKVLVLGTAVVLLLTTAACGVDKGSYVRENKRIVVALPEVPGAARLSLESSPYYEEGGLWPKASGYTTNVTYQAPPGMTDQEVVDFYIQRLKSEWELCGKSPVAGSSSALVASFIKDGASLDVWTYPVLEEGEPLGFEIAVDYRSQTNSCPKESPR